MSMKNVKVGIVVKIKDHVDGHCGDKNCSGFSYSGMRRLVGQKLKIGHMSFSKTRFNFENEREYVWSPCMIEILEDSKDKKLKVGDVVKQVGSKKRGIITKMSEKGGYSYVKFDKATAKPKRCLTMRLRLDTTKPTKDCKVDFDSVIIAKDKVEQIKEAISQREYASKIFEDWGFGETFEKGTAVSLLFYGIPGTGKTLMAQAIADHLDLPLEIIGAAEIQTSEPGGAERKIKALFNKAKAVANKIIRGVPEKDKGGEKVILLDECDSLLMDRNQVGHIMSSQINTLLSEIEKFKGVVIFTTNRLGRLDPALERRITGKIQFDFPSAEAREKIWERMIPLKAPLADDVDFKKLAEYPLTGGNIKNCVLNAARRAAHKKLDKINHSSFKQAVQQEIQSVTDFAAQKEQSYTQGGMVASRDYDVVHGEAGIAVKNAQGFLSKKKVVRAKKGSK